MNKYEALYHQSNVLNETELLECLTGTRVLLWEDKYWISKCLLDKTSNNYDVHILISALNDCFIAGLTPTANRKQYFDVRAILSKLYMQVGLYDEAINNLGFMIDNFPDTPTWMYLDLLSAQICTDQLIAILRNPTLFFRDLHYHEEETGELFLKRKSIFVSLLNKSIDYLSASMDVKVDDNSIRDEATKLGLQFSREWQSFEQIIAKIKGPSRPILKAKIDDLPTVIEIDFGKKAPLILQENSKTPSRSNSETESKLKEKDEYISELLELIEEKDKATATIDTKLQEATDSSQEKIVRLIEEKEQLLKEHERISSKNADLQNENDGLRLAVNEYKSYITGNKRVNTSQSSKRILFYGASQISKQEMFAIADSIGIDHNMLEIHDDYEKNKTRTYINKNSSRFLGVIVSASAHKARDTEGATSPSRYFKDILPTEETRTANGELKCTRESFRRALEKLYWDLIAKGLLEC